MKEQSRLIECNLEGKFDINSKIIIERLNLFSVINPRNLYLFQTNSKSQKVSNIENTFANNSRKSRSILQKPILNNYNIR